MIGPGPVLRRASCSRLWPWRHTGLSHKDSSKEKIKNFSSYIEKETLSFSDTHSKSSPPRRSGERIIIRSHLQRSLPFHSRARVWASRSLVGKKWRMEDRGLPRTHNTSPPNCFPTAPRYTWLYFNGYKD